MGLFDRFIKNRNPGNNNTNLAKTSELLDEGLYWTIISKAVKKALDQDKKQQILILELKRLTPPEIIGFKLRTDKLLREIYSSDMWCAAYIINGGCSDDGFDYFSAWVISRGKEVYYKSKSNPDSLVDELNDDIEGYEYEDFLYVAPDAFKSKTGQDIYDYIIDDGSSQDAQKSIAFTWQEDEPKSLQAICPKLFEAKWN